jgi:hypothetical protein
MGNWSSTAQTAEPDRSLLPNGQPAPLMGGTAMCAACEKNVIDCRCRLLAAATTTAPLQQPVEEQPMPSAASSATSCTTVKQNTTTCDLCHVVKANCFCPEIVGKEEADVRMRQTLAERIEKMLAFCDVIHKSMPDNIKRKPWFDQLTKSGQWLAQHNQTLMSHKNQGVITTETMQAHVRQVEAWLRACDVHNAEICDFAEELMTEMNASD